MSPKLQDKRFIIQLINIKAEANDSKAKVTGIGEINLTTEDSLQVSVTAENGNERVYKIIKFKIDAGYELLSSLKKVLSRRMQEIDTERMSRGL